VKRARTEKRERQKERKGNGWKTRRDRQSDHFGVINERKMGALA